jgi:peptidoglycan/LPS O-acetylase OafA/YrhL
MIGLFQRFARGRLPVIDGISEHGYGFYFFHYPVVLWLQYALLALVAPAVAKGVLVLIGTVLVSLGLSVVTERILVIGRDALARGVLLLGGELGANGRVGTNKLLD